MSKWLGPWVDFVRPSLLSSEVLGGPVVRVSVGLPSLLLGRELWAEHLWGSVVSVGVGSVGFVDGNWVRSINILDGGGGSNKSDKGVEFHYYFLL